MRSRSIPPVCIALLTALVPAALAQHHGAGSHGAHGEPAPHAHRAMALPPRTVSIPDSGFTLPLEESAAGRSCRSR